MKGAGFLKSDTVHISFKSDSIGTESEYCSLPSGKHTHLFLARKVIEGFDFLLNFNLRFYIVLYGAHLSFSSEDIGYVCPGGFSGHLESKFEEKISLQDSWLLRSSPCSPSRESPVGTVELGV